MLGERELATLRLDLPVCGLMARDVGAAVVVQADGVAHEVELAVADGRALTVETLAAEQVEPVAGQHILHARRHVAM